MKNNNIPSLSWSRSRVGTLQSCERQYYYNYYFYWNGWFKSAPERVKKAYYLKRLSTYDMVSGLVLHDTITQYIKAYYDGNQLFDYKVFIRDSFAHFRKNSIEKLYLTSKAPAIFEFHYTKVFEQTKYDQNIESTVEQFDYFIQFFKDLVAKGLKKDDILTLDDKDNGYLTEMIDGEPANIYMIIDFAYRLNGKVYIIDWKTGKLDSNDEQMKTYGLFALANGWCNNVEDMIFITVYTKFKETIERQFTQIEISEVFNQIYKDLELFKIHDTMKEKDFKCITNTRYCEHCKFMEICSR